MQLEKYMNILKLKQTHEKMHMYIYKNISEDLNIYYIHMQMETPEKGPEIINMI